MQDNMEIFCHLILTKESKTYTGEKAVSSTKDFGKMAIYIQKTQS
jgi:hypothetical protein